MTIRKGDKVTIKPEWQDAGDDRFEWIAVDDADKGRVTIMPLGTGLHLPPQQVVTLDMLANA